MRAKKDHAEKPAQLSLQPKRPLARGCLVRHPQTGGHYLKIRWPGEDKVSWEPLITKGNEHATKNREVALRIARRMIRWRLKHAGELPAVARNLDLLVEQFRTSHTRGKARQAAFNSAAVRLMLSIMGMGQVQQIALSAIQDYVGRLRSGLKRGEEWVRRPFAPKTIVNHLGAVGRFCRWLQQRNLLTSNPVDLVDRPNVFNADPGGLSDETRDILLARATGRGFYSEMLTFLKTGIRLEEARSLRWADIFMEGDRPHIRIGSQWYVPKGNRIRRIPLNPDLLNHLKSLPRGKPEALVFEHRSRREWFIIMRKLTAGLPGFGPKLFHRIRSDVATRLAHSGISAPALMQIMGWEDLRTARRYIDMAGPPPDGAMDSL